MLKSVEVPQTLYKNEKERAPIRRKTSRGGVQSGAQNVRKRWAYQLLLLAFVCRMAEGGGNSGDLSLTRDKLLVTEGHRGMSQDFESSHPIYNGSDQEDPSSKNFDTEPTLGSQRERDGEVEDVIIVLTVDGTLAGISKDTGRLLWRNQSRQSSEERKALHESRDYPAKEIENNLAGCSSKSDSRKNMRPGRCKSSNPTVTCKESSLLRPLVSTSTTSQSHSSTSTQYTAVPSINGNVYLTSDVHISQQHSKTSSMQRNHDFLHSSSHDSRETKTLLDQPRFSGTSARTTASTRTVITSVEELLQRAPFLDSQGRFYVGSQQASTTAIDSRTGKILQVISPLERSLTKSGHNSYSQNPDPAYLLPEHIDPRHVIWIGRVDRSILIQDARTGLADVQFSVAEITSVAEMQAATKPLVQTWQNSDYDEELGQQGEWRHANTDTPFPKVPPISTSSISSPSSSLAPRSSWIRSAGFLRLPTDITACLISTPSGNLALMDEELGQLKWVSQEQFHTPIAFALDGKTGQSVQVDIIPDVTRPSSNDLEYLRKELTRQLHIMSSQHRTSGEWDEDDNDRDIDAEQTIISKLEGSEQLYALPLGCRIRKSAANTASPTIAGVAAAAAMQTANNYHVASLASTAVTKTNFVKQLAGSTSRGSMVPRVSQEVSASPPRQSCSSTAPDLPCIVHSSKTNALPDAVLQDGQDNAYAERDPLPKSDEVYNDNQEDDWALPEAKEVELMIAANSRTHSFPHQQNQQPQNQGQQDDQQDSIMFHPNYGYVYPNEFRANISRPTYSKFFKILGSWLPPTIALIFVLSFELGRRKRLKDDEATTNAAGDIKNSMDVVERDRKISKAAGTTPGRRSSGRANSGVAEVSSNVGSVLASEILERQIEGNQMKKQQQVIQVSDQVLGYGGQGTVVYKGILDGREVAVKRMLQAYHASADREIRLLIESDGHPNVVRYFLKEVRGDFVYLALELCDLSLHDLICVLRTSVRESSPSSPSAEISTSTNKLTQFSISAAKPVLLQIASGVKHLHSLRIVHRDLKPANILLAVSKQRKRSTKTEQISVLESFTKGQYIAKISDMGLGKQIVGQSSLGGSLIPASSLQGTKGAASSVGVGPGSVGWQAPEVMNMRQTSADTSTQTEEAMNNPDSSEKSPLLSTARTSRSVDIFSLGCIFFSTLMPGHHPFGEWYEREANIMHNRPRIDALRKLAPEAFDLVRAMLNRNPKHRPTAKQICDHPFFWASQKKLAFLCEFSDRLECDTTISSSVSITLAIERGAVDVVGASWDQKLDDPLISNMQRFRTYDPSSVRDLLRLIRNKHHHFDELPLEFRNSLVGNQDALLSYFEDRFPRLLAHCWNCCSSFLSRDDPLVIKYEIALSPKSENDTTGGRPMNWIDSTSSDVIKNETEILVLKDECSLINENCPPSNSHSSLENLGFELDSNGHVSVEKETRPNLLKPMIPSQETNNIVVWEGSTASVELNCRGWSRSEDTWTRRIEPCFRKRDQGLKRAMDDPKFRTRLCNHWDISMGTSCPMRKKNKCVFAHGPVELRVKEGKKKRWGKLVDKNGDNKNPRHSGGEDTYGAARSIETVRRVEGKWNTNKLNSRNKKFANKKAS